MFYKTLSILLLSCIIAFVSADGYYGNIDLKFAYDAALSELLNEGALDSVYAMDAIAHLSVDCPVYIDYPIFVIPGGTLDNILKSGEVHVGVALPLMEPLILSDGMGNIIGGAEPTIIEGIFSKIAEHYKCPNGIEVHYSQYADTSATLQALLDGDIDLTQPTFGRGASFSGAARRYQFLQSCSSISSGLDVYTLASNNVNSLEDLVQFVENSVDDQIFSVAIGFFSGIIQLALSELTGFSVETFSEQDAIESVSNGSALAYFAGSPPDFGSTEVNKFEFNVFPNAGSMFRPEGDDFFEPSPELELQMAIDAAITKAQSEGNFDLSGNAESYFECFAGSDFSFPETPMKKGILKTILERGYVNVAVPNGNFFPYQQAVTEALWYVIGDHYDYDVHVHYVTPEYLGGNIFPLLMSGEADMSGAVPFTLRPGGLVGFDDDVLNVPDALEGLLPPLPRLSCGAYRVDTGDDYSVIHGFFVRRNSLRIDPEDLAVGYAEAGSCTKEGAYEKATYLAAYKCGDYCKAHSHCPEKYSGIDLVTDYSCQLKYHEVCSDLCYSGKAYKAYADCLCECGDCWCELED